MDYHGTSAPDNKELAALIGREKRERSKTYKEISDESKAANISADVAFQTKGLIAAAGKNRVDLNDLDDVKRRVISYMDACTEAAAIPSFIGLCTHGLGLSRAAVYKYLTAHSGTPTTAQQYLFSKIPTTSVTVWSLRPCPPPTRWGRQ